jgi:putative oxidoreductase
MQRSTNNYLLFSGIVAALAGVLHVATIFGGPAWYRFIGATEPVVRLAAKGHMFPVVVCLVAAGLLFVCACFAFSGARLILRLPFLRTALVLISGGLLIHGLGFIPAVLLWPQQMMGFYDGAGINTNLIINSIICTVAGITYALGARKAWHV